MIRHLNYTNRRRITEDLYGIRINADGREFATASVSLALAEMMLPPDADVVVEAYRRASYMRVRLGTVASYPDPFEFPLTKFGSPDDVKFRIKVVGRGAALERQGPLVLALADRVKPREGDEDDIDYERLVRLVKQKLNGEIWRLDFEDGPSILFEEDYWNARGEIVKSGWFFPLVLPTVLRESLIRALDDNYRDLDDERWQSQWLRFATMRLAGDAELPSSDEDEVEEWINGKVEAFCRDQRMTDRFARAVEREAG